jgi:glyoxylase-like metal-dependent hydrolase (beta-lactamase superfamily II)
MANGNSNISRRQFVGASGALLAGAAVAGTLTGQVVHAQQTALQGRIVALKKGPVTIHTYVAPEASVQVTSHIIETAKSLVIVDTQFLQSFGKEVRAYADSLKKPISQVILSHEHPDHWYGGNLYKDVPFTSTATVQKNIQAQIDSGAVAANVKTFAPDGKLTPGVQTIDGVTLDIEAKLNAESPEQLVIKIPEAGAIIVQDLLYNGLHFFPGLDRKNWLTILESFRALKGFDTVLVGHGLPTNLGQIDHAIEYLTFVNETVANAKTAEDISAALAKRYPAYQGQFLLTFWPLFFKAN